MYEVAADVPLVKETFTVRSLPFQLLTTLLSMAKFSLFLLEIFKDPL